MRVNLQNLKIEDKIDIEGANGAKGYIRRKGRNDYVLRDLANNERSCWGTLEEIRSDARFFVDNGTLRPPLSERW